MTGPRLAFEVAGGMKHSDLRLDGAFAHAAHAH
jgi:hypothetical protein